MGNKNKIKNYNEAQLLQYLNTISDEILHRTVRAVVGAAAEAAPTNTANAYDGREHDYVEFLFNVPAGTVDFQIYKWSEQAGKALEYGKYTISSASTKKAVEVRGGAYLEVKIDSVSGSSATVNIMVIGFKK